MHRVSGPDLVIAACRNGVVGSFPVANARSSEQLDEWMTRIGRKLEGFAAAPFCPNLVIRRSQLNDDLACVIKHKAEMVITSVGSPASVIGPLHEIGCLVFADIATVHHAEKAIEAGVDGLILLTAGAGGRTGWMNPLAFVRAVRARFDGPIVLAGGIADGHALWTSQVLGCDLAYMGTKFIATQESMAPDEYKQMLVQCEMDDVLLTSALSGLRTNLLRPSISAAGLDPDKLSDHTENGANRRAAPRRPIWSAGHSVSGVTEVSSVATLIERTATEYELARRHTQKELAESSEVQIKTSGAQP